MKLEHLSDLCEVSHDSTLPRVGENRQQLRRGGHHRRKSEFKRETSKAYSQPVNLSLVEHDQQMLSSTKLSNGKLEKRLLNHELDPITFTSLNSAAVFRLGNLDSKMRFDL